MKLRIFISSVQKEFAEERRLLKRYIAKNPAYRRLFDTFVFEEDVVAADRRTDEVYLDELRQCDVYIGLVGNEYGFEDSEGVSPTEREYDEATRLGITQTQLSLYLNRALGGQQLTTLWEDDYRVPVVLYLQGSDSMDCAELEEMLVPTVYPGVWVPVRQVATVEPSWHHSSITRRNSIRSLTVGADLRGQEPQPRQQKRLEKYVDEHIRPQLPADATISYGGLTAMNNMVIPQLVWSVVAAVLVLLVLPLVTGAL